MIKKSIFLVLFIACLIVPVMGEEQTINFTDSVDLSTGIAISLETQSTPYVGKPVLYANEITSMKGVKTVSVSIRNCAITTKADSSSSYYYYPTAEEISNYYPFTLESSTGFVVGSGDALLTFKISNTGLATGANLILTFDSYDIGTLTGTQKLTVELSGFDYSHISIGCSPYDPYRAPGNVTTGFYYTTSSGSIPIRFNAIIQTDLFSDFSQTLTYDYHEDTKIIDMSYDRNGLNNEIVITGSDSDIYYTRTESENINLSIYDNIPIIYDIENTLTQNDWTISIPETSIPDEPGPSLQDPAEFTSYIYDAQTGHLISGASTTKTYDDLSSSQTSDPSGVVHDVVYWEDTSWASFTASAAGYSNSTVVFNYTSTPLTLPDLMYAAPGSDNVQSFHLIPTALPSNSSYALTFQVQQEISPNSGIFSRSVDASVSCDNIQHLTGPSGTTWFNVTAGSHAFTVSKNGFETVQGTSVVSAENMMETVYLHLSQEEPTASVGNETSGEVGDEDMHEAVAEAYSEFGAFIPEAVMIGCVLFLLSMFKKF